MPTTRTTRFMHIRSGDRIITRMAAQMVISGTLGQVPRVLAYKNCATEPLNSNVGNKQHLVVGSLNPKTDPSIQACAIKQTQPSKGRSTCTLTVLGSGAVVSHHRTKFDCSCTTRRPGTTPRATHPDDPPPPPPPALWDMSAKAEGWCMVVDVRRRKGNGHLPGLTAGKSTQARGALWGKTRGSRTSRGLAGSGFTSTRRVH